MMSGYKRRGFFSGNKKKDAHLMLSRVCKKMSGEQSKIVVLLLQVYPIDLDVCMLVFCQKTRILQGISWQSEQSNLALLRI